MKHIDQLNLWVDNISAHNHEYDECCPDFSCCRQDIITPRHIKIAFREAYINNNENLKIQYLMMFLGQLLKKEFNVELEFDKINRGDISDVF